MTRDIRQVELRGISGGYLLNLPVSIRDTQRRLPRNHVQGEDSITSLGNLCQCFAICTAEKCCLMFIGNLLCSSLCSLPLVLALGTHHSAEPGSVLFAFSLQTFTHISKIPLNLLFCSPSSHSLSSMEVCPSPLVIFTPIHTVGPVPVCPFTGLLLSFAPLTTTLWVTQCTWILTLLAVCSFTPHFSNFSVRILWGAVSTWTPVRPSQQSLLPPRPSGWALYRSLLCRSGMAFPLWIHADYSWWFSCPSYAWNCTLRISCFNTLPEIVVRLTQEESLAVYIKSYLASRGLRIFTQSISHRAFCSVLPKRS